MFVESQENFEIIRDLGVTLFGMGRRFRRRAERMSPNDRVLFYVTGLRKWPATATIASECFEDDSPLFKSNVDGEHFPFRIKLTPDIVLDEQDYIDALLLAPRLDYVKRWPAEDWPLAFFDRLHLLPQKDFRLIEGEMRRIKNRKPRDAAPDGESDQTESTSQEAAEASETRQAADETPTSTPATPNGC